MTALVSDPQLFRKWLGNRTPIPRSLGTPAELKITFGKDAEAFQRVSLAVSTHVDDFKAATE